MTPEELQELVDFIAREVMEFFTCPYSCCYYKKAPTSYARGGFACKRKDWQPHLPNGQIEMVIDRMVELGWGFAFYRFASINRAVAKFYMEDDYRAEHSNRLIAILLAAKAAIEAMNPTAPNQP